MSLLSRIIRRFLERMDIIQPVNPREAAQEMLDMLEQHRTAASLAMALADEAHERLQAEVENHEALGRQAAEFLRAGDELAAQRLVNLQLQSAEEVRRHSDRYKQLQLEAERAATTYRNEQAGTQERLSQLPEVEDDERYLRAREKIEAHSSARLESPTQAFDAATRELRIRRKQLESKALLASDPNAEIDARIRRTLSVKQLEEAMSALRARVDQEGGVVDAEFTEVADDCVNNARKLLEAPRFETLASPVFSGTARVGARVRR